MLWQKIRQRREIERVAILKRVVWEGLIEGECLRKDQKMRELAMEIPAVGTRALRFNNVQCVHNSSRKPQGLDGVSLRNSRRSLRAGSYRRTRLYRL